MRRGDVAGINRRVELQVLDVIVEHLDFGHVVNQMGEIKRAQGACFGVFNHPDGSTGVDDQDAWSARGCFHVVNKVSRF